MAIDNLLRRSTNDDAELGTNHAKDIVAGVLLPQHVGASLLLEEGWSHGNGVRVLAVGDIVVVSPGCYTPIIL